MNMETNEPLALPHLEVLNGPQAGRMFPLGDETVLGRKDTGGAEGGADILLPDARISLVHARILKLRDDYFVEDLRSTNGTYHNAIRLVPQTPCPLREGSNLQLGGVHLRFRPGAVTQPSGMATPWESEVGYNEQAFDLALAVTSGEAAEQANISMLMAPPDMPPPEVSMTLDAREVIQCLDGLSDDDKPGDAEVLRRMRALAQFSIGLGAGTHRESLFTKAMDLIFEIFPTAERAFVVLHDEEDDKADYFTPVAAATREPGKEGDTLALSQEIIDEVVAQRRSILSTDAGEDRRFKSHDSILDQGIRSLMCVPLLISTEKKDSEVLGLIQVDTQSLSHSFKQADLQILTGLGAQVAIALKNFRLYENIENLFESFVTASVHAIEARDPTTAGHSFRVAEFSQRLAEHVDSSDHVTLRNIRFSADQLRELRYAALLHDFGKVGVREHVLVKANKLYHTELALLESRFNYACASLERQVYRDLVEQHGALSRSQFLERRAAAEAQLARDLQKIQRYLSMVKRANEPAVLEDEVPEGLRAAARFQFLDENGQHAALLTATELESLTLSRGSLTPEERNEIQSHVSHTFAFLSHIPWAGPLSAVADIAHAHHEKLDGSGYPRGLMREDIPMQARLMAVTDIYDALTAGDRPYKRSVGVEAALDILNEEARQGKVERVLVDIFIESGTYKLFDVS
ncbi:MAG: FHA domain-containing protein [Gammaproteobacteria bacterium]|nr:FHA domain-containing protein [Gammaproteobacteria bacterium]